MVGSVQGETFQLAGPTLQQAAARTFGPRGLLAAPTSADRMRLIFVQTSRRRSPGVVKFILGFNIGCRGALFGSHLGCVGMKDIDSGKLGRTFASQLYGKFKWPQAVPRRRFSSRHAAWPSCRSMTWMATPCGRISGTMPRLGMHGVAILDFGWMLDGCFGFWIHPMEAFFPVS